MKSIMISIKPKYVADILNGRKTLEIIKTMPKCDLPINVYIYCTKDRHSGVLYDEITKKYEPYMGTDMLNGKVIAKFTLNTIEQIKYHFGYYDMGEWTESYILENACLTAKELDDYLGASKNYDEKKVSKVCGYVWHIDNLVIFDKPRELREFKPYVRGKCMTSKCHFQKDYMCEVECELGLTKAPITWCYVEVEK